MVLKMPKVGLALSSGAARGAVHIGVIKALEDAKISIDCLSGSSAGAIVAACYACGTLGKLEGLLKTIGRADVFHFLDLHLSKESFVKGNKALDFFQWLTNSKKFSDLKIPIYIMSSDIKTGKEAILTRGSIAEALMASVCIPPLFKPVRKGRRLLVDGGLLHLIPVEVLYQKENCDFVIASNIQMKPFMRLERDARIVKTFKQLKANYFKAKTRTQKNRIFKNIVQSYDYYKQQADLNRDGKIDKKETYTFWRAILDCFEVGVANSDEEEKLASILIKTNVDGVKIFDFYRGPECIKWGEAQAKKETPKIRKLLQNFSA